MRKILLLAGLCLVISTGLALIFSSNPKLKLANLSVDKNTLEEEIASQDQQSQQETTPPPPPPPPPVNFVLYVGLEGTGHHLWHSVVEKAPIWQRIQKLGLKVTDISTMLFHRVHSCKTGLWSVAMCEKKTASSPNVVEFQRRVANEMRMLSEKARNPKANNKDQAATVENPIYIPVNIIKEYGGPGMMSYPNIKGEYHPLQYPYVDLWFEACEMADVSCKMVYLYRDPYEVIKSTTIHRKFNKDALTGVQQYITLLQVIYYQFLFNPHAVAGCWDFNNVMGNGTLSEQHESVRKVMGWGDNNTTEYFSFMSQMYKPGTPMNVTQQEAIIPPSIQPYTRALFKSHNNVIDLCHRLQGNFQKVEE